MALNRKNIRLAAADYRGKRTYFVTICTEKRIPRFVNQDLGHWLVRRLQACAAREDFSIHAYTVMPDHLHVLPQGAAETCDLIRFVSLFKQVTGFAFEKRFSETLWQFKFYDHIVRSSEPAEAIAWYIWLNPVRQGLCKAPQQYPLSGSFTRDWQERCSPVEAWSPPWKRGNP